jgi:MFS family permease
MTAPHAALLAEMAAVAMALYLVPFRLRESGTAPAGTGLAMLAFPAAVMVSGLAGGLLADRWGPRRLAVVGMAVLTVALALIVPLDPRWPPAAFAWRLAVAGVGAGLFAGPNQAQVMADAPPWLLGTTGGSTSLARQLGAALGPALATTVWGLSGYGAGGMRLAFGLATALALAAAAALTVHAGVGTGPGARNITSRRDATGAGDPERTTKR